MKHISYIIILLIFSTNISYAYNQPLDSLLCTLDKTIANKQIYTEEKEVGIEHLKTQLQQSKSIDSKIAITKDICLEYIVFMTDSALLYTTHLEEYARRLENYEEHVDSELFRVRILKTIGLLKESSEILDNIDTLRISNNLKEFYFYTKLSVYNLLRDSAIDSYDKIKYRELADEVRARLIQKQTLSAMDLVYISTEQLIMNKQYDEALEKLLNIYYNMDTETRDAAVLAYAIARVYEEKGDKEKTTEYYVRSAIADIKNGIKEYMSLRKVAALMFEYDDIDRSYSYMKCAMEDAIFYNARIRSLEASEMFLVIDQSYQKKEEHGRLLLRIFLGVTIGLLFFIGITLVYVYKQNGKLSITRDELSESNMLLKDSNRHLSDSNLIKEEYLGLYIGLFSDYLSKIEKYKLKAQKIAKTQGEEALIKFMDSSLNLKDDLDEFYKNFDATILRLFPDFVEQFNSLLSEDERIYPKSKEILTPELRIFALIRLGVTDSIKISHFLRYSTSTIYNYRTKIRNKAKGNRDEFESKVIKIGLK